MTRQEFLQLMEELLAMEPGVLSGSERLRDLEGWGSLAVMECMARIEEKTEVVLRPKLIAACETVEDLFALLPATSSDLLQHTGEP